MAITQRPSLSANQSLSGRTRESLYDLSSLLRDTGSSPHLSNVYQVPTAGITPEQYEMEMEHIASHHRADIARRNAIQLAIHQTETQGYLGDLAKSEFASRIKFESAEQEHQKYLGALYKTAAAKVDAATEHVKGQEAFERFAGAQISLQTLQAKNTLAQDKASATIGTEKLNIDTMQSELQAKLSALEVRLNQQIKMPGLQFALPNRNYKTVDVPKVDLLERDAAAIAA